MRDGAVIRHTVTVLMTPADLREIASEMEENWRLRSTGGSTMVRRWKGQGIVVEFAVDQVRMEEKP